MGMSFSIFQFQSVQFLIQVYDLIFGLDQFLALSKCFTYVTKTIANLTTCGRKPGDYNGTIVFEIDIMKNSSPLNLKLTFFAPAMSKPK